MTPPTKPTEFICPEGWKIVPFHLWTPGLPERIVIERKHVEPDGKAKTIEDLRDDLRTLEPHANVFQEQRACPTPSLRENQKMCELRAGSGQPHPLESGCIFELQQQIEELKNKQNLDYMQLWNAITERRREIENLESKPPQHSEGNGKIINQLRELVAGYQDVERFRQGMSEEYFFKELNKLISKLDPTK